MPNFPPPNFPPIVSGPVTGTIFEDGGTITLDALARSSDPDGQQLSVVNVPGLPPFITYDAANHTFTLDANNPVFQHLAQGEGQVLGVNYGVTDGIATSHGLVVFNVNGVNDAPTVTGPVTGDAVEGGPAVSLNVLQGAADVDDRTVLGIVPGHDPLPAGVSYDPATHSLTLDPTDPAYNSLGAGQTATVTVGYDVTDGLALTPQTATWTVHGTNDAPVVSGPVTATVAEGGGTVTLDALANASDPDSGDVLHVVGVPPMPAFLTFDAASQSFTLDASSPAFDHLAAGETQVLGVTYGVSDGAAHTPGGVQFSVTGVNDAPTVSGAVTGAATEGGAGVTLNALQGAADVDDGAVLSVVLGSDPLPAGVSFDAATNGFTLDPTDAAYNSLGVGQIATVTVGYGVSDGDLSTPQTLSWTVTGTNDAPTAVADTGAVADQESVSLFVLSNDTDPDNGDSQSIASVSATSAGGHVSIVGDHLVYTADAGSFDLLGAGQTATDTFTYTLQDGSGASSTAAVTVTVSGVPNGPTLNGGNGMDTLTGTAGREVINGGNGADNLSGLAGSDTLSGGNGDDTLSGGAGSDRLDGGNGNDVEDGGTGADTLTGGHGDDRFVFGAGFGHDVVTDFGHGDHLQFSSSLFANFADVLSHAAQVGADVVIADAAGDAVTLSNVQLSSLHASDFLFA